MPSDDLRRAFDAGAFRALGERTIERLAVYLERATRGDAMPVLPWADPEALLARWPGEFPEAPSGDLVRSFDALLARTLDASIHLHHPRYVGHQVTSPHPLAALCELAGALLNNGMAIYEMGPVATVMEHVGTCPPPFQAVQMRCWSKLETAAWFTRLAAVVRSSKWTSVSAANRATREATHAA